MPPALRHPFLVLRRLVAFTAFSVVGLCRRGSGSHPDRPGDELRSRADWMQRQAIGSLNRVGVQVECIGHPPSRGMIVSNHLSYLDILVFASTGRMAFVSKAEVASWPLLGSLAKRGGTLFLRREQRSHVAEIAAAFRPLIEQGVVVAIFPEGTSSGGESVLPFRPSLLEPAAANDWPVTPAWVTYELDPGEGTVANDVAYWRDMTMAPHLLNLFAKRTVRARVVFGEPVSGIADRKELARTLHAAVCRLRETHAR